MKRLYRALMDLPAVMALNYVAMLAALLLAGFAAYSIDVSETVAWLLVFAWTLLEELRRRNKK